MGRPSRLSEAFAVPQRAGRVLEQLGFELLPAKPRAFVFADDLVEETRVPGSPGFYKSSPAVL